MSTVARPPAAPLTETLSRVAADYQTADVIPHCPSCSRPCCKLDALVLELEWKQVKPLWQIEASRKDFDRQLAAGKGPVEIRAANGLYYIHSKPCPAYDETAGNCRVYGQDIKPPGCSDFPVYEDEGDLIVDLRCEAVDLDALIARLKPALGSAYRLTEQADRDFPFLVTLSVKKASPVRPSPGKPVQRKKQRR